MNGKKIVALLLAIVMVLGLGTMASASVPANRVQINNMMVDASMIEAKTEKAVAVQAQPEPVSVQTNLSPTDLFPPISNIKVDGFDENVSLVLQNAGVIYTLTLPFGTTNADLVGKNVLITLGGTSGKSQVSGDITITYNNQTYTEAPGTVVSLPMPLSIDDNNAGNEFTVRWTAVSNGTSTVRTQRGLVKLLVAADTTDVSVSEIKVIGEDNGKEPEAFTAGGVTRYSCSIGLEKVTTLTGLTVDVTLGSSNANATLGGVSGTKTGNKVTFTNVDLTSSKELVVTNGPTANPTQYSRTYQVSAYLKGQDVTVYIAIRTYTVSDWLDGTSTTAINYYDYEANGYGSGTSLNTTERNRIATIAAALAENNAPNAPIRSVGNKRIFDEDSYFALSVSANSNVMTALTDYLEASGLYASISNGSYVSSMGNGNTVSAQIGEFDCGSASGWMFTARNAVDDLDTPLPNAGANTWPVYDGMFIDWYYTAAYGADFGYSMFDM